MTLEYRKLFQTSLDSLYAKEIQDIYANYMDPNVNQNEKSNELKIHLRRFANKIDVLKQTSAPLAIAILNVMYGLSSNTRDNLDIQVIQTIKKTTTDLYNFYKHSIMADDLINKEELMSEEEDLDRILYLCFEVLKHLLKLLKRLLMLNLKHLRHVLTSLMTELSFVNRVRSLIWALLCWHEF